MLLVHESVNVVLTTHGGRNEGLPDRWSCQTDGAARQMGQRESISRPSAGIDHLPSATQLSGLKRRVRVQLTCGLPPSGMRSQPLVFCELPRWQNKLPRRHLQLLTFLCRQEMIPPLIRLAGVALFGH